MARRNNIKPFTLGAALAPRLCGEDALLNGAPTLCSRCTYLYSLTSSHGTHIYISIQQASDPIGIDPRPWPCSCGCSTRSTPFQVFPASADRSFRMDEGRYRWAVRFTTQTKLLVYSDTIPAVRGRSECDFSILWRKDPRIFQDLRVCTRKKKHTNCNRCNSLILRSDFWY